MFRTGNKEREARDAVDAARQSKDWEGALAAYKRYTKYDTNSCLNLIIKGERSKEEGKLDEAKDHWTEAAKGSSLESQVCLW